MEEGKIKKEGKRIQKQVLNTKDKIILVVDDYPYNLTAVESILAGEGYENILMASSGSQALSMINERKPDLVLLDIMMPDIDGFEVCSTLQRNEETSDIPVIMLTARISSKDLKRGFDVGAVDYIEKPFDKLELIARTESALRLRQSKDMPSHKDSDELTNERISLLEKENDQLRKKVSKQNMVDVPFRDSDEKLRILFESVKECIIITDLQGHILEANEATLRISGYSCEEVIGRNKLDFVHEKDRDRFTKELEKVLFDGRSTTQEFTMKSKDGREYIGDVCSSLLQDGGGAPVGFITVIRDITEPKRFNEKLEEMSEYLEKSRKELQQFAYVASHDLQEPLRMVSSYVQLLSRRYKGKLDSDADEFIYYAVDGAKRMQEMINSLLEYSRVGTRGKPFKPTDLNSVLGLAIDNLTTYIEQNGAEITYDPMPIVMADRGQLVQLFQNLMGNAIKFHSEKPPRIHVSVEQKADEWIFSVSDNGIGIDPDCKEQVFQIFSPLHNKELSGTGTGLAICKKIVERHGGRIWMESDTQKGSTFYFTIPMKSQTTDFGTTTG